MTPVFLDVDDVLDRHAAQIRAFGGALGLRDRGLLESAVSQPTATFDGAMLHQGLAAIAAAYLFHIVKNHPFVDGNKRTGLDVALTFLEVNGVSLTASDDPVILDATLAVAEGRLSKADLTAILERVVAADP